MTRNANAATPQRRSIATVCLSGTLEDKLAAAAGAGFGGVEIFENDLVASHLSPEQVRDRCVELGMTIDLYQPFRDFDSTVPDVLAASLRRATAKFRLMRRLGTDTILLCSSVAPTAVADLDVIAEQLHLLAGRAADYGLRIAYEALAWGRQVNTWQRSWEAVRRADHPALGLCLDSFHVLSSASSGSDTSGISDIPCEKLFFLQLADAPRLRMDVLQWSRHYRLFPGQGGLDVPGFLASVLAAGYRGPLSLEVFNDVYRQADPARTAIDAMRSLVALEEAVAARPSGTRLASGCPPKAPAPTGHAFTELAVEASVAARLATTMHALGFTHTGNHRSKPVQLFEQGAARVLLNTGGASVHQSRDGAITGLGLESPDPTLSARRAQALLAPLLPRTRGPSEVDLSAIAAPDGTEVFFCRTESTGWRNDFLAVDADRAPGVGISHTDHVALAQPFDYFDEATLFYSSVLGLTPQEEAEFAAPFGLVRNRFVSSSAGAASIAMHTTLLRRGDWAPAVPEPQVVAFATCDILATADALRGNGAQLLSIPDNYYDDLASRIELPDDLLATLRRNNILYDRDEHGEYYQLCTDILGSRFFFEIVQRVGGYRGDGTANAPIRMAAHRHQRLRSRHTTGTSSQ